MTKNASRFPSLSCGDALAQKRRPLLLVSPQLWTRGHLDAHLLTFSSVTLLFMIIYMFIVSL